MKKKKDPNYDLYIGEISVIKADIEKLFEEKVKAGILSPEVASLVFHPTNDMSMRDQHLYLNCLEKSGIYECGSDEAVTELVEKAISTLPGPMENLTYERFQKLNRIMLKRLILDKSISQETIDMLLKPMQSLDWEGKAKYADELITIMETSKTEQEIIERATCLPKGKK